MAERRRPNGFESKSKQAFFMGRSQDHKFILAGRYVLTLAVLALTILTANVSRAQIANAGIFQFTTTNQFVSERDTAATIGPSVRQSIRGVRVTVTRVGGASGRVL